MFFVVQSLPGFSGWEMASLSTQLQQVRVACGICTSIAIVVTLVRLYVRTHHGRLWIEDIWAAIGMFVLIVRMVASFIDPNSRTGIARFYLMSSTFYASIWSARLSILFSILRLRKAFFRFRTLSIVATLFFITWGVLTAQVYWECERQKAWKNASDRQCKLSCVVGVCQLINIVSDGLLVYFPIRVFTTIRDKKLRFRLTVVYGTCIITTLVSFVHTVYFLNHQTLLISISAVAETTASIIVCNIPVLVTAVFKLREEDEFPSSPDGLQTPPMPNPVDDGQEAIVPLRKIDSLTIPV